MSGIPVTPVNDSGAWNAYQVIEVTVKSAGATVAQTQATVPTSDEINCARCHTQQGETVFHNVLAAHDRLHSTTLESQTPVLCAHVTAPMRWAVPNLGRRVSSFLRPSMAPMHPVTQHASIATRAP